jgi:MFS family permease
VTSQTRPAATGAARFGALPGSVWALGVVSLLMDVSSELIHAVLPVFMTTVLGASMVTVGLVEGIAEATAAMLKVFSGALSDWLGKRKLLLVLGYGLAAITKPLFPVAPSVAWVFAARFMDRVGKGIRGAPRDALVADLVPERLRGTAYGLRQSLDSIGAVLGPVLAIALLAWAVVDIRTALWVAVVPAAASVLVLIAAVREPERAARGPARPPIRIADARRLAGRYWFVVALGAVLTLARFSEAFLVLRASDLGLSVAWVPAVMVLMNVVYAGVSYPAGIAFDGGRRRALLFWGLVALVAADLALAAAGSMPMLFAGVALWGLHMGLTQGVLATLVAATAPEDLRGTAFGIFNLISGAALLVASVLAGALWQVLGPAATFYTGAAFTAVALAGLVAYRSPANA